MRTPLLTAFENKKTKDLNNLSKFRPGDTVRVHYKIQEGSAKDKFRIQTFEGVVIRLRKGLVNGTFTVRKIGANNIGVERVFPTVTPLIDKVELVASGVVRRSRLFYLRNLAGKAARIRSRYVFTKTVKPEAEKAEA